MRGYAQHYSGVVQGEVIPGRESEMTRSSDGAMVFRADAWTCLHRFLILGSESGSYYASSRKLTRDNAAGILKLIHQDGERVVREVVEVSESGRAPRNDPAEFVLALCCAQGGASTRAAALAAVPKVCRIGTHLFHFVDYVEALGGGWGRAMRRTIRQWMKARRSDRLAYQLIKYRQRDGWSFRDLIRLSHATSQNPRQAALFEYVKNRTLGDNLPDIVRAAHDIHHVDEGHAIRLIRDHGLPHECVPNERKDSAAVWAAILESMPLGAMIRNLAKMTSVGLLGPMSRATNMVVDRLADGKVLRASRLHPMSLLIALRTYARGRGFRGSLVWSPVSRVIDALDAAFYRAFEYVEPTGLRTGIFLDVSGSMNWTAIESCGGMTPRDLSAALALVTANVEPSHEIYAFTSGALGNMARAPITARQRLDDAISAVSRLPAGGTDLSLPFRMAMAERTEIDTFIVLTDNETNAFRGVHPSIALKQYRQKFGIPAKLVVVGMVANQISIADPRDAGMMDVVGFDTSVPRVIADFAKS